MPAPAQATYSAAAKIDAHEAFLALIDAGAAAGKIKIRDNSDVLLGTITLTDPAGTVNGTTGQLTLTAAAAPTAVADGTAAYAEITDSDDTVHLSLPAEAGTSPVSGKVVINTLTIVTGATITLVSATIG